MAAPEAALERRARRAYEFGRLRAAGPIVAAALPMVALCAVVCGRRPAIVGGAALLGVLGAAGWRGGRFARGARVGLLAGLGPLLLPMAASLHVCTGGVCLLAPATCALAGLAGGAGLSLAAWRRSSEPTAFPSLATGLVVAGLAGSLGCAIAGVGGLVGMAIGIAAGSLPVMAWRPARP